MNETNLLIGSLSNDLFRIATLRQRGSLKAADRFLIEAKRWAVQLAEKPLKKYILNIVQEIIGFKDKELSLEKAEKYLMFGVLLQNYTLHND